MIDIVFSDSACGSLKMAQHYGEGEYSMIGSVIVSCPDGRQPTEEEIEQARQEIDEQQRRKWNNAAPLGGNSEDVFGFNLVLSIGDISEDIPSTKRQKVIEHLWSIYPQIEEEHVEGLFVHVKAALKQIFDRAASGEDIRMWYSSCPDDICGMYWFISRLQAEQYSGKIFMVELPHWESDEVGKITSKVSWGEVEPQEWGRYLPLQKEATSEFCQSCAECWNELQAENAPLRAVFNGKLVSVPETIYDSFIEREIEAEGEEFNQATVIGHVLGRKRLGISDSWIALRMETMIESGVLEQVSAPLPDSPIYHRTLRKR